MFKPEWPFLILHDAVADPFQEDGGVLTSILSRHVFEIAWLQTTGWMGYTNIQPLYEPWSKLCLFVPLKDIIMFVIKDPYYQLDDHPYGNVTAK